MLLTPLVDKSPKPICSERKASYTEHSQNQMNQINREVQSMWEMLD